MGTLGKADQLPSFPFTKWDRGMFGKIDRHRESALAGERQTRAEHLSRVGRRPPRGGRGLKLCFAWRGAAGSSAETLEFNQLSLQEHRIPP